MVIGEWVFTIVQELNLKENKITKIYIKAVVSYLFLGLKRQVTKISYCFLGQTSI